MPNEQTPSHQTPAYETLIERVRHRAGLESADEARAVLDATLGAMATCLAGTEAQALADQLPAEPVSILRDAHFAGACDEDELYRRVERSEDVGAGFAREHVQAVVQVLGEALVPEVRQRLARALPSPLAALLATPPATAPQAPSSAPPGHGSTHETSHAPAGTGHTLADGRPGSQHPLSEGHPERGQPDSVAGTDDPYGDRKLSSSHPQPRSGHTLAEGKPGSDHPVSESD